MRLILGDVRARVPLRGVRGRGPKIAQENQPHGRLARGSIDRLTPTPAGSCLRRLRCHRPRNGQVLDASVARSVDETTARRAANRREPISLQDPVLHGKKSP